MFRDIKNIKTSGNRINKKKKNTLAKKITNTIAIQNYRIYGKAKYIEGNFNDALNTMTWLGNDNSEYKTTIHSKGNNVNIIIGPDVGMLDELNTVVVTFSEIYYPNYVFVNKLPKKYFFPKKYLSQFPEDTETCKQLWDARASIYNRFDLKTNKEKSHILIEEVIEYAPKKLADIGSFTNKIYNTEKELSQATIIDITRQISSIFSQLSELLTHITENGGVWTDLKLSNVLLRADNTIMIADKKAFFPINNMPIYPNGNLANGIKFTDISLSYLSEAFEERIKKLVEPKDVLSIWESEYSYTLGCMIYHMITGTEVLREAWSNSNDLKLNFEDHPFFRSPEGKEIRIMIECMINSEPENRMPHAKAAMILEKLAPSIKPEKKSFLSTITKKISNTSTKKKRSKHLSYKTKDPFEIKIKKSTKNSDSNSSDEPVLELINENKPNEGEININNVDKLITNKPSRPPLMRQDENFFMVNNSLEYNPIFKSKNQQEKEIQKSSDVLGLKKLNLNLLQRPLNEESNENPPLLKRDDFNIDVHTVSFGSNSDLSFSDSISFRKNSSRSHKFSESPRSISSYLLSPSKDTLNDSEQISDNSSKITPRKFDRNSIGSESSVSPRKIITPRQNKRFEDPVTRDNESESNNHDLYRSYTQVNKNKKSEIVMPTLFADSLKKKTEDKDLINTPRHKLLKPKHSIMKSSTEDKRNFFKKGLFPKIQIPTNLKPTNEFDENEDKKKNHN